MAGESPDDGVTLRTVVVDDEQLAREELCYLLGQLGGIEIVAQALTGQAHATAADGIAFVQALADELAVPGLGSYGMTGEHIPDLVGKAAAASSMKGNPLALTTAELTEILERAL